MSEQPKFKTLSGWFNGTGHEMGKTEYDWLKETVNHLNQQLTDENEELMEIIDMVYGCLSNPEFHHIFAKTNYTALMELMQAAEGVPVAKQGDSDDT